MNQDKACYNSIIQFQDLCVETVESKYGDNENSIGEFFRMNRKKTIDVLKALLQTISETENSIKQYESLLQQDNLINPELLNSIKTEIDKLKTIQRKALLDKECITFYYFYDENKNQDFTYFFNNTYTPEIIYTENEKNENKTPEYIQQLIDKGLIDTDGETVLARSLNNVAECLYNILKDSLSKNHFIRFKQAGTNKPYSQAAIKSAITFACNV